jgi:hypothetical protein
MRKHRFVFERCRNVVLKQLTKLIQHNGLKSALLYMKTCRTVIYRYTALAPLFRADCVSLTRDGIPSFFDDVIPYIRKYDKDVIQVVLSILTLGRLYTSVGHLSISSIIKESSCDDEYITDEDITNFVKENSLSLEEMSIPEFYIRSSSGPSGPAMTSIIQEAKNLPKDLYKVIIKFLPTEMREVLNQCRQEECYSIPSFNVNGSSCLRRITVVEDKEFKNRVIAIFDY